MAKGNTGTSHRDDVFRDWKPEQVSFFYREKEKQRREDKAEYDRLINEAKTEASRLVSVAKEEARQLIVDAEKKLERESAAKKIKEDAERRNGWIGSGVSFFVFLVSCLFLGSTGNSTVIIGSLILGLVSTVMAGLFLAQVFRKWSVSLIAIPIFLLGLFIANGSLQPREVALVLLEKLSASK